MIIVCPACGARYKFDESKLGTRPRARTKCAKCGAAIEIENPMMGAMTLPPEDAAPETTPSSPGARSPEDTSPGAVPSDPRKTERAIPVPPDALAGGQTVTGQDMLKMGLAELPRDRRFSLAVIQGPATGQIFQVTKPRVTIGRSGCDVNLDDPEASRTHAAVEILGERVMLRDLGSTNGTFVDFERVENAEIVNHGEFRVGQHVLMLIITEVD
jgi:predicted Zn finger-like uncharacterized protein